MKSQDVIDLLPIVADRGWMVTRLGWMRDKDNRCPLCAFTNEVAGTQWHGAAQLAWREAFGTEPKFLLPMIMAADGENGELRRAMKQALGLDNP